MARFVETCHGCGAMVDLDDHRRFADHDRIYKAITGDLHSMGPCPASGQRTHADRDKDRERGRRYRANRKRKLIDPFRIHAAVALDALIERREYPDLDILIAVAAYDYQAKSPHAGPTTLGVVRFVARKSERGKATRMGDAFCVWCGTLVMQNVRMNYAQPDMVRAAIRIAKSGHVAQCSLEHVAFDRTPVAPNVRRLPAQMTIGDDTDDLARVEPGGAG